MRCIQPDLPEVSVTLHQSASFSHWEGKRLAGFHGCHHGGIRAFLGTHIDEAIGIIDYPGSLRLCQRREDEKAGEE